MSEDTILEPSPSGETAQAFPWPPAEDASILHAFARTWRGATFEPTRFFRALPREGSLGAALLYYVPLGILVSAMDLVWSYVWPATTAEREAVLGSELTVSPVIEFLLSPLLLIMLIFVAAGTVHLLLRLFGGASADLAFTTRIFAFAYSPQLFGVIPRVGSFIGWVWMVGVAIIALREGHRTSTARAAAAVLIPLSVLLFFVAMGYLLARAQGLLEI